MTLKYKVTIEYSEVYITKIIHIYENSNDTWRKQRSRKRDP